MQLEQALQEVLPFLNQKNTARPSPNRPQPKTRLERQKRRFEDRVLPILSNAREQARQIEQNMQHRWMDDNLLTTLRLEYGRLLGMFKEAGLPYASDLLIFELEPEFGNVCIRIDPKKAEKIGFIAGQAMALNLMDTNPLGHGIQWNARAAVDEVGRLVWKD